MKRVSVILVSLLMPLPSTAYAQDPAGSGAITSAFIWMQNTLLG